jgi:hypothetical protein
MDNLVSLVAFFLGLSFGAFILWLNYRTKIKIEYERARSESEADLATLTERLAGKELQIQELREDLDRELAQSERITFRVCRRCKRDLKKSAGRRKKSLHCLMKPNKS